MAKFVQTVTGDFAQIAAALDRDILDSAISAELVDQNSYHVNEVRCLTRVYEKYYMRNSSRASLSVTIIGHGDVVQICAIGAGGGDDVLFRFSWGAEENFVQVVQRSLQRMGY